MSDTMRPMFTNEGFAVRACRGHFHVTVGGCDLALPGDPFQTREAALDVALSEAVATVAALTAENAQLRETLTLGLGEQESVIAGLRAENERLVAALTDIAEPLAAIQRVADATGYKVNGMAVSLTNSAEHLRALARAALPSSRETTAPPADKTREIL